MNKMQCSLCEKIMENPSHEELLFHEKHMCQWPVRQIIMEVKE